jgi:hypothetical protein
VTIALAALILNATPSKGIFSLNHRNNRSGNIAFLFSLFLGWACFSVSPAVASPVLVFECDIFLQIAPAPVFAVEKKYTFRRHVIQSDPTDEFVFENWAQGRFANNGELEVDVYPTDGEPETEKALDFRTFILDGINDVRDEIFDEAVVTENLTSYEDFTLDTWVLLFSRADGSVLENHLDYPESFDLDEWDQKECYVYWRSPFPVICGVGSVCEIGLHQGVITSVSYEEHAEDHSEFGINAGMNDAWVNADAPFQGLFITVYPGLNIVFVAWFTFDTALPPAVQLESLGSAGKLSAATFGADDQRWVTAVGTIDGDKATLNAELTTGGKFNTDDPLPTQDTQYGTLDLEFSNCKEGKVTYNFPSAGLSGEFNIGRVLEENAALCEALNAE